MSVISKYLKSAISSTPRYIPLLIIHHMLTDNVETPYECYMIMKY